MHNVDIVKWHRRHRFNTRLRSLDLLVCHIYYAQAECKSICYRSGDTEADGSFEVYHINRLKQILGHDICSQYIFIHITTVSEMSSRIFGVDKRLLSRCLQKENLFFDIVPTHSQSRPRQHRLSKESKDGNGCPLWRPGHTKSFATMRYKTFRKKVVCASSFVTTERLLSTECVTKVLEGHTTRSLNDHSLQSHQTVR